MFGVGSWRGGLALGGAVVVVAVVIQGRGKIAGISRVTPLERVSVLLPSWLLDHGDLGQRHGSRINSALFCREVCGPVAHVRERRHRAGAVEGVGGDLAGNIGDGGWTEE